MGPGGGMWSKAWVQSSWETLLPGSLGPEAWARIVLRAAGPATPEIYPNGSVFNDFPLLELQQKTKQNYTVDGFRSFLTPRPDHAPRGPGPVTTQNEANGAARGQNAGLGLCLGHSEVWKPQKLGVVPGSSALGMANGAT